MRLKLFFKRFIESLQTWRIRVLSVYLLCILAAIFTCITLYFFLYHHNISVRKSSILFALLLIDLFIIVLLTILLSLRIIVAARSTKKYKSSIQRRIIIIFFLITVVPTVIITAFSAYFFVNGIQSWFGSRVSMVLDQSLHIGRSYIEEYKVRIKNTALSMTNELGDMYYDVVNDSMKFSAVLSAQAQDRAIDEAIIFQPSSKTVLATTNFTFTLAYIMIDPQDLNKASMGNIVILPSQNDKIVVLAKLQEYDDSYLMISKTIDVGILDYVDKTRGAAAEYNKLKQNMLSFQIKFLVIFILISILLILVSVNVGVLFANSIIGKLLTLVDATDKVRQGNLNIKVSTGSGDDEFAYLASAFNAMLKQLRNQGRDLLVAQKSLAWQDVAKRVAHEIRNPLTPLQLAAERIKNKFVNQITKDQDQFIKYGDVLQKHIKDIGVIVSEFTNFARMPNPEFTKVNISNLVTSIIDSRKIIHSEILYEIEFQKDDIYLNADENLLRRILLNLIKNSEEALELLKNNTKKITVILNGDEEVVILKIDDSGPGFKEENKDKLLHPYYTTKKDGTGLGLAIVKQILEEHRAEIHLGSGKNGGALVEMKFSRKFLTNRN